jgi:hypothetical protein
MNTFNQNITETNEIIETFNMAELMESGYVQKYASNFGYEHLVKREMERWNKYEPTFYVVKADASINYGLDFKIMVSYKADGCNFFMQFSLGSSCLSAGNLRMVVFEGSTINYLEYMFPKDASFRKQLRSLSNMGFIFN